MTQEQQALYQADVDCVVADLGLPHARGRLRLFGAWVDEETGESFPDCWVAEIRLGRSVSSPIVFVDAEHPHDAGWIDICRDEAQRAARRFR